MTYEINERFARFCLEYRCKRCQAQRCVRCFGPQGKPYNNPYGHANRQDQAIRAWNFIHGVVLSDLRDGGARYMPAMELAAEIEANPMAARSASASMYEALTDGQFRVALKRWRKVRREWGYR